MTDFYKDQDKEIIKKQLPIIANTIKKTIEECVTYYELENCVKWIKDNDFKKVCLQFPDELLRDSTNVTLELQKRLNQTVYILGDTSFESCCVDYVAAEHVESDGIIHFGSACFSQPTGKIPCLYIYEKELMDCAYLKERVVDKFTGFIVVCLDTPYMHLLDEVQKIFSGINVRVTVVNDFTSVDCDVVFVGSNERKMFELNKVSRELYVYNPKSEKTEIIKFDRNIQILKRRYYLIEKIKDSQVIGILVGTVAVKNYLEVIDRIKTLLKLHKKKYYIIVVGKPTVAKLANFSEIDLYVLVSCSQNETYETRDFYQPIVTPHDIEAALNPKPFNAHFTYDYNSYLQQTEELDPSEELAEMTDISLISGKLRSTEQKLSVDASGKEIAEKGDGTLALNTGRFLEGRTWKGLEQNLGKSEVKLAEEGRMGIASGYDNEPS